MKRNTSSSSCAFGPQLVQFAQIELSKKVKKFIHYDCDGGVDDDVPDEDEIYIKENLLLKKGDNITDPGDDLSIVNINVSVLYSSEGGENSQSKNSCTLTYSPDSKKKNSTSNSKLSLNNTSRNTLINNTANISNQNNSNSETHLKDVINKRKMLIEIQNEKLKNKLQNNNIEDKDELLDLVHDYKYKNNNFKITNITNYIVGAKSFDMKAPAKENMLRDIKALHLITQKALSTHSKHNPIDSIDDDRKNFFHFQNLNTKKALFIDDNSDLPAGIGKDFSISKDKENYSNSFCFSNSDNNNNNKREKQIINIININNNYNISNINMPQVENKINNNTFNNFYEFPNSTKNLSRHSEQSKKSFRSMNINNYKKTFSNIPDGNSFYNSNAETPLESARSNMSTKTVRKLIPRTANKEINISNSTSSNQINPQMNNKSIKDIIKSVKKDQKGGKFIKLIK